MSEPLHVAFVVEGKTDYAMLREAVRAELPDRQLIFAPVKPELSEAFERVDPGLGEGWPGIYRWCRQAVKEAGALRDHPLFRAQDLLIVELDADVASRTYGEGHIDDAPGDLPCCRPCPPPHDTTNELRLVVLGWMGEADVPRSVVFCTPSKALEAWIWVALYPDDDPDIRRDIECRDHPETLLASKPQAERLVRSGKKDVGMYRQRAAEFGAAWPLVKAACTEAARFAHDLHAALTPPG